MDAKTPRLPPRLVIDLARVRESLRVPTLLFARLARKLGAVVSVVSPGNIEVRIPRSDQRPDEVVQVHVQLRNVFVDEARAYLLNGLPVPEEVLRDMERWDRENGR